ncbi:hypothetical protein OAM73_04745 [Candidatus Pelagibacter sp.]|nr:hypothetical protein [Candidatus Pelagibacter sp.]
MLTLYVSFRLFEWAQAVEGNKAFIKKHVQNVSLNTNLDCLILGGSNSVFSISAEQMSNETKRNCYNLSLLNEGFSDSAYWHFLTETIGDQRTNITQIFYSSVMPIASFEFADIQARKKNEEQGIGISGNINFEIIGRSVASYIKSFILDDEMNFITHLYPAPNEWGDFNFNLYKHCNNNNIDVVFKPEDNLPLLANWANSQIKRLTEFFPNATIYIVVPSTMRDDKFNSSKFDAAIKILKAEVIESSTLQQEVLLVVQPPFTNIAHLCDGEHHGNEMGRKIRTSDLIRNIH